MNRAKTERPGAVREMTWEGRAEAALALLIVRDDEIEALRRRIQGGEIQ